MHNIKLKSWGSSVSFLQELLGKLGYKISNTGYFDLETDEAVKDFQMKNHMEKTYLKPEICISNSIAAINCFKISHSIAINAFITKPNV
ncbi:peptidoglycan-binding domain-containing protein [Algoriphagus sp. NG3]|uniref:peptidoglycan-binding domain-containing protein n=1 Tax=Algoriphagus sp. NG3 TaxID=3097546 RepID=UPI0039C6418D